MKRQRSRGAIIAVVLLGVLIFGGVLFAWNTINDIFQPVTPSGPGKAITIVIRNGETTLQIANDLQSSGLIRNAYAFRLWARIRGLDAHLQSGAYDHLNTQTNFPMQPNILSSNLSPMVTAWRDCSIPIRTLFPRMVTPAMSSI